MSSSFDSSAKNDSTLFCTNYYLILDGNELILEV